MKSVEKWGTWDDKRSKDYDGEKRIVTDIWLWWNSDSESVCCELKRSQFECNEENVHTEPPFILNTMQNLDKGNWSNCSVIIIQKMTCRPNGRPTGYFIIGPLPCGTINNLHVLLHQKQQNQIFLLKPNLLTKIEHLYIEGKDWLN